jgi:flagellar biosynthesis protein FlhA
MEVRLVYALIPLVDPAQGAILLERIGTIRRQMAMDLGLCGAPIRIRDNIQLKPTEYLFSSRGARLGGLNCLPDHYLALKTGGSEETLVGIPTTEPAFGLSAVWITPELRDQAEMAG